MASSPKGRSLLQSATFCATLVLAQLILMHLSNFSHVQTFSAKSNIENALTQFLHQTERKIQADSFAELKSRPVFLRKDDDVNNHSIENISLERNSLPDWMTEYFSWHKKTKASLNETNWNATKYMVMVCEKKHSCGGISDRLKPLPFAVLEAARYQRLLLIWWIKPKPLEDFFLPPDDGVDWRVPEWLKSHFRGSRSYLASGVEITDLKLRTHTNDIVFRTKVQAPSAGEDYYAKQSDANSTYADVSRGLFLEFFKPVPRLASLIERKMKEHNLVAGQYAATHLRAMYGNRKWRHPNETIALTVNGINCASSLLPGAPLYFASDVKFANKVAREYGRQRSLPVASLDFVDNPIHFDKDPEWQERDPSVYDDTFIDLFMLSQSRCVAYSNGGYGTFGSLLSYDAKCSMRYFKGRKMVRKCSWTSLDGSKKKVPHPEVFIHPEMLVEPRKEK